MENPIERPKQISIFRDKAAHQLNNSFLNKGRVMYVMISLVIFFLLNSIERKDRISNYCSRRKYVQSTCK